MTVTTWLENLNLAIEGTYLRYRDKLAKPDVLILDDKGMRKMSSNVHAYRNGSRLMSYPPDSGPTRVLPEPWTHQ